MAYVRKCYKEALAALGGIYKMYFIDGGGCVYKDFGNGYDVEIIYTPPYKYSIYIWKDASTIVERRKRVQIQDLKEVMESLEEKYTGDKIEEAN